MKPLRSNGPSSDTIYQAMAIIPYVKGISERFKRIGNLFNVRTIFKLSILRGTLMKTGLVRDAQQTKQCWKEAKVLQTEPITTYRKTLGIRPHVSARPSDQSTQFGHLSHLDSRYRSRSQVTTTPPSVDYVKIVFLCLYYTENLSL
jgi:hypothetical protein